MSENDKFDTVSSQDDIVLQEMPKRRRRGQRYQVTENKLNRQEESTQEITQYTCTLHTEPVEEDLNIGTQEFNTQKHQKHTKKKHTQQKEDLRKISKKQHIKSKISKAIFILLIAAMIYAVIAGVIDGVIESKQRDEQVASLIMDYVDTTLDQKLSSSNQSSTLVNNLKSILYTLPNNAGSVEIVMPETPLTLSTDYQSLTITEFRLNLINSYSCELLFSGEVNHNQAGTESIMIDWRICDDEGYVVLDGMMWTPSLATGEKIRDYSGIGFYEQLNKLNSGKYSLDLHLSLE